MKLTDKPGGSARKLRPLTAEEKRAADASMHTAPMVRNTDGGYGFSAWVAVELLVAVGFFAPPAEALKGTRNDGRAREDSMMTIHLLRAIASRWNEGTGQCYPSYETTARDAGIPGGERCVRGLANRLIFPRGYLGRIFRGEKGRKETIRFYDFGPILAAAEIVENGFMPVIDPPTGGCCRIIASPIADESADSEPEPLQPNPSPTLADESKPDPCRRINAAGNNFPLNNSEHGSVCEHVPAASGKDSASKVHYKLAITQEEADAKLKAQREALRARHPELAASEPSQPEPTTMKSSKEKCA